MWYLFITSRTGNTVYASQAYMTEGDALDAQENTRGKSVVRWGRPRVV
jgi:hypothetical protein